MITLSEEQQYILDTVKGGDNVLVDAVAGTGKTTLILSIARELQNKQILQMTYNSSLRADVKKSIEEQNITNLSVHTFHSLLKRYYTDVGYTDTEIRRVLYKKTPPKSEIENIDILVLDECQDMTILYFQLMVKLVRDMGSPIQLLILGDYMQGLYEFKGADIRFLTLGDKIWSNFSLLRTNVFQKRTMKMSFRITNQMRHFINDVLLGEDRMNSCKEDVPVKYIRNNKDNITKVVYGEISRLLDSGVKPSEIFVLANSIKGTNDSIRKLENKLTEKKIPCHVPMFEHGKMDDRVVEGKLVFSTFHTAKGRQRKYVFVVGFDNSYMTWFARNLPKDVCPNTLYVAVTRATQGLYLLEESSWRTRPLDFMKLDHIEMKNRDYIDFKGQHQTIFQQDATDDDFNNQSIKKHKITPTELVKFIPENVIENITEILDRIFIKETVELDTLDIPNIIQTKQGFYEEVSDLNGIAIPNMYYDSLYRNRGSSEEADLQQNILYDVIYRNNDRLREKNCHFLRQTIQDLPEKLENIDDYLYTANVSIAVQELLYFKLMQIERDEYTWLSQEIVDTCKARMRDVIEPDCKYDMPIAEKTIIHESDDEQHERLDELIFKHLGPAYHFRFTARTDLITESTVWELKCTGEITTEHLIQVVFYAWIWYLNTDIYTSNIEDMVKVFKIFNIKTGEIIRLNATMDELNEIMLSILKAKYQETTTPTDEEFLETCQNYLDDT
jgi:hypothetical protein|tara:strand:- start:111 stop:2291 length:2181 start_codon:yes stop_codon:yes gene_type:complete